MSVNIFHKTGSGTGTLQKVAGNTVILDANVSEIRNGTFSISATSTEGYFRNSVTFSTPMPDTDYIVNLETNVAEYLVSNITPLIIDQKTVNGFRISWYGKAGTGVTGEISGKYYAFKPIPMDGYTELQNKVNNPDNMPIENSNNLVKSGGVYEALKDAGTVFSGTKAEWEALSSSEQDRYEVVCLTDDEESGLVDEYSTSETKTNKVWIDGRPIYRKVMTFDNITNLAYDTWVTLADTSSWTLDRTAPVFLNLYVRPYSDTVSWIVNGIITSDSVPSGTTASLVRQFVVTWNLSTNTILMKSTGLGVTYCYKAIIVAEYLKSN